MYFEMVGFREARWPNLNSNSKSKNQVFQWEDRPFHFALLSVMRMGTVTPHHVTHFTWFESFFNQI